MILDRRRPRLRLQAQKRSRGRLRSRTFYSLRSVSARGDVNVTTFYRRNLPHMEKDGATYFVSFSTRRELVLTEEARTLIYNHCLFENGRKVHLHAFVVMPDHVHTLFTPLLGENNGPYSLAEIMNGIKGASSHSVNKLLGRRGALWEPESFDRMARSEGQFEYAMLYIVQNPIAAGLAKAPDEYRWAWRESAEPEDDKEK